MCRNPYHSPEFLSSQRR
ncbi:hypothetical protein ECEC4196_1090, partial [Escherichia coli EC4196]